MATVVARILYQAPGTGYNLATVLDAAGGSTRHRPLDDQHHSSSGVTTGFQDHPNGNPFEYCSRVLGTKTSLIPSNLSPERDRSPQGDARPQYIRGTTVNKTYGIHKNLYI